jgi:hypothetical protein
MYLSDLTIRPREDMRVVADTLTGWRRCGGYDVDFQFDLQMMKLALNFEAKVKSSMSMRIPMSTLDAARITLLVRGSAYVYIRADN